MGKGGSSTLGNLNKRRAQIVNAHKSLGINTDAERGGPQTPTRTQPNPPPPPQAPAANPAGNSRDAMIQQVGQFLQAQQSQAQGGAPPAQPQQRAEVVSTRPGPNDTMVDRVQALGAANRSPETQFFRLSGREGTPRELAIFSARLEAERQLGRPPTQSELMLTILRSSPAGGVTNSAFELPATGQQPTPTAPTGGP